MSWMLRNIVAALLLGLSVPAVAEPSKSGTTVEDEKLGHEMLKVTNDMWFLLSGVGDKATADEAALQFVKLIEESERISDQLYAQQAMDLEALNMMHYRIAEVYESLSFEFESLCKARCYGSKNLIAAFQYAVRTGLFDDESLPGLEQPKPPLTDSEARQELARLKRLIEPDRAVLSVLQSVKDAGSATRAAEELATLSARLQTLMPEHSVADRTFADRTAPNVRATYAPIEPLLWGIRSEIVRIAALPGYDDEPFDAFSDALDTVFQCLGDAHNAWFEEVFDESFRSDLDDALHENATTSN
ncbi:MAG: hypothetical protein IJB31_06655 [Akkermansia sp.]|nr:hypothetical protein [Akkermansia sp.]